VSAWKPAIQTLRSWQSADFAIHALRQFCERHADSLIRISLPAFDVSDGETMLTAVSNRLFKEAATPAKYE
jgi:hypothetical protein